MNTTPSLRVPRVLWSALLISNALYLMLLSTVRRAPTAPPAARAAVADRASSVACGG